MTYRELTEGIIKLWKENARLKDVNDLTDEYFLAAQQRAGGNRKWLESEVTLTVNRLTREAYTAMQREENDNSQRERTDLLCLVITNLIGDLEEAGIISWTRMDLWLQNMGELNDRSTAYFLGLDAVAELEAEKRKKGLLPDLSTPRASLNLKWDPRGVKSEDDIVSELQEFLGVMKDDVKASQVLRCFLFGGEDDGRGMVTVPKANRLAWMLKELRLMGIYGFPGNVYQIAERWFLDVNGEMIKNMKVKACTYRDAETQARIKKLLLANISVN